MKNFSRTTAVPIFLLVFAGAAYAGMRTERSGNNLTSGLVGYWPFDGADFNSAGTVTYDRSGQGNNGTMTGGPLQIIGKVGQGMKFDGNNDYVSVNDPGASSLDITGEVTISAWIKQVSQGTYGDIAIKGDDGVNIANYGLETYNDQLLFFFSNPSGTYHGLRTTSANFATGTWYHVAAVYNDAANNIDLYVDGALKGETIFVGDPENNSIQTNNRKLYIGWDSANSGEQFNGTIDDVRIYNRALKANEIKRLYNMGGAGMRTAATQQAQLTGGLIAYWPFNGGDFSGTAVYDRSGTGNNGTMVGSALKVIGKLGQGLGFDGSNNYVNISSIANDISSGPFSTTFWFRPAVTFNASSPSAQYLFSFSSLPSTNDYHAWLDDTDGTLMFTMYDPATHLASTTTSWAGGRWYFVAVTYSDTGSKTMTLYIDGQSENSRGGPTRGTNLTPTAMVGALYDGTLKFNGTIDDVRVYNRELKADEVKRLYNMGAAGMRTAASQQAQLTTGLVGYWPFDGTDFNSAGTATYDRSGQNYNGTMTGGPLKVIGKIGQGLSFNGAGSDYVNIGNTSAYNFTSSNFSFSFWYRPQGFGVDNSLISRGAWNTDGYVVHTDETGALNFYSHQSGAHQLVATNSGTLKSGEWQHVAFVRNGTSGKFYFNSVEPSYSVQDAIADPASANRNLEIRVRTAPGSLDDVRVYNRALSADEVKRLYNMGH